MVATIKNIEAFIGGNDIINFGWQEKNEIKSIQIDHWAKSGAALDVM